MMESMTHLLYFDLVESIVSYLTFIENEQVLNVVKLILKIIIEATFAGIAAMGFAIISKPPLNLIIYTTMLAGIGRGFRFFLMDVGDLGISFSTFLASALVGILGVILARKLKCAMEVISFTALLPMVPGLYAYNTIYSLVKYSFSIDFIQKENVIILFFDNGVGFITVITALAVGVAIPFLFFYNREVTMNVKNWFKKGSDHSHKEID